MTRTTRGPRSALFTAFRRIAFAIVLLALFGSGSVASAQNVAPAQDAAPAQESPTPEIAFGDPAPQLLSPKNGGTFEFDVGLKNAGKLPGTPAFRLLGKNCGQVRPATDEPFNPLARGAVAIESLRISGATLPATCHLELRTVEAPSANQSLKQLKLAQHPVTWFLLDWLWGCLIVSIVAVVLAWGISSPTGNDRHLGAPAWDFAKSWMSNLTFAGGIVTSALALSALPELTRHGSKTGYATVALLLAFSILIAPLLSTLLASGSVGKSRPAAIMYKVHVALFFISCLVTVGASLAQIVVLFFLLHEVFRSAQSPYFWFGVVSFLLGAMVWCYAVRSMVLTINLQRESQTGTAGLGQSGSGPQSWSLL